MTETSGASLEDLDEVLARRRAREVLACLPTRLAHTEAAVEAARDYADRACLSAQDRALLVVATWYHDIGYGRLAVHGWHPLDGAHMVAGWGLPSVANLVAWHTTAPEEARLLGLTSTLNTLHPCPDGIVADLLTHVDMTTGPAGERFTYEQRLEEIEQRHGATSIPVRAMVLAGPRLMQVRHRVLAEWNFV